MRSTLILVAIFAWAVNCQVAEGDILARKEAAVPVANRACGRTRYHKKNPKCTYPASVKPVVISTTMSTKTSMISPAVGTTKKSSSSVVSSKMPSVVSSTKTSSPLTSSKISSMTSSVKSSSFPAASSSKLSSVVSSVTLSSLPLSLSSKPSALSSVMASTQAVPSSSKMASSAMTSVSMPSSTVPGAVSSSSKMTSGITTSVPISSSTIPVAVLSSSKIPSSVMTSMPISSSTVLMTTSSSTPNLPSSVSSSLRSSSAMLSSSAPTLPVSSSYMPRSSVISSPSSSSSSSFSSSAVKYSSTNAPSSFRTSTSASSSTSSAPTALDYATTALYYHNKHRSNHSAADLSWDPSQAATAAKIASSCIFAHQMNVDGGGYGQNLAAYGSSGNVAAMDPKLMLARGITNGWYYGEVDSFLPSYYGQADPDPTTFHSWGHFSQVVWKASSSVGCASQYCAAGTIFADYASWFTVCNYKVPGNLQGAYGQNIGVALGQPTIVVL